MREIKLRAWLPNLNKMSYDVTLYANGWIESVTDDGGEWKHKPDDANLMQYTGLKDKNGKEIYEGDFIKLPEFYETREATAETFTITGYIEFKDGAWMFSDSGFVYEEYESYDGNFEVVGNIHENPELLAVMDS